MIRLRPHRVGKAESLFVANLKPFFDSIDPEANLLLQPAASTAIIPADIREGGSLGSIRTMPKRLLARQEASTKPSPSAIWKPAMPALPRMLAASDSASARYAAGR